MGYNDCELSLLFTDDNDISDLNNRFLDRMGPTNVLAFPQMNEDGSGPEMPMLGDIVISLDAAMRDAEISGLSFERTVGRLLIHGLLHLLGYDHELSEKEALRMEQEFERLVVVMERQLDQKL